MTTTTVPAHHVPKSAVVAVVLAVLVVLAVSVLVHLRGEAPAPATPAAPVSALDPGTGREPHAHPHGRATPAAAAVVPVTTARPNPEVHRYGTHAIGGGTGLS